MELRGLEPLTFSLRTRRATNCATAPDAPRTSRASVVNRRNPSTAAHKSELRKPPTPSTDRQILPIEPTRAGQPVRTSKRPCVRSEQEPLSR